MTSTITDRFSAYHADTVEVARSIPDNSIDFSVFSPPFASLYTYSNSPRDMGNAKDDAEFFAHYRFLIREQFRAMKPGRLVSIHCMLMPTLKERDGYIGLRDFRGDIIEAYQSCQLETPCSASKVRFGARCDHSFVFHSEVVIWKDPVTAMQRTKALGLLHKQVRKDSAMSRQGIPDYVVTMRKPGVNPDPISHWATDARGEILGDTSKDEPFEVADWQRYASPIWTDIDPSDTLQHRSAREHDDERHICPLQLEVIRRCVKLWTRRDDVVWSPFMGIGSEGYVALQEGRRFIGAELKTSYYEQAVRNLTEASTVKQESLFALGG